ncbi:TRAP transporter substrate-binding protein DctP [Uliginosibacterium sp. H3]|uniref:TRAP transporter substrate-binding protein DctP n=1 Tax=Uliginosibacterium silvisoli TaxID=3114758 RepID=A0ABU6K8K2_9RHOO|nr:TRAP transporter substrate-binding protein DctP [Uliginosibacterium sp. H3]
MTITRKIFLLVCVALLTTATVTIVSLWGLSDALASVSGAAKEQLSGTRTLTIVMGLLGVGVMATMGWFMGRAIVKPLEDVQKAITRTADKLDFTESIRFSSSDELGRIVDAYNRLLAKLRGSFMEIQASTAQMLDVTEEVDRSSRKIARNSQMQSDASTNMAASVEEMTVSISMVAQQAKDASSHTQESRNIAEHSSEVIVTTLTGIQTISDSVREAAGRIKALRSDCDSISTVAKMIREIAEQTNLLALNAAIEAARAGEQGRGFAVVADEVRKLAERTAKSTQEISSLLGRMQDSAKLAVTSMVTTEEAVESGVDNARAAGESIDRIKDGSTAAANVVEDISGAIREQQAGSTAIAQNIEQMAQMSEQNSAAAAASAEAIGRMSSMSREIVRALSIYRVDASASQKVQLRVADIQSDDFPTVRALKAMSELLSQRTNGRISLKVYASGSFGSEKEALEQMKTGALDMARINISPLNKSCPETIIPTLPFLFRDISHMQRALDGAPGEAILASCLNEGYVGLAFYDSGVRCIYTNKPIRSIADVRGMKLRVPQSDLWIAVANAMGATATPMSIDEIINGAKMGLIDAAENNLLAYESFKHSQVFKHFSHTDHSMAPDVLVFSKKSWDGLSEEDQKIIRQAAKESVPQMRRFWADREGAARKSLIEAGCQFVTGVDKGPFQQAMRPVYDRFVTTDKQRSLLSTIQSM